jgi:hypothetical protein
MTSEQILALREQQIRKFDIALQIRDLLDEESDRYASADWARVEAEILQMVKREEQPHEAP